MRQQTLNIGLRRAWFEMALVGSAIVLLLWVKYWGPQSLRDVTGYLLFAGALIATSYLCLRSIIARRQRRPAGECVVLAQAKSPAWFYAGTIGVGLAFILNTIVLLNLIAEPTRLAEASRGGSGLHLLLGISLCLFALGVLYAWLGGYQVRVTASLLENWSLFGGYESIDLAEIKLARIAKGRYRNRPPFRLEILSSQASRSNNPIIINLKVFREVDIDRVFHWLGSKLDATGKSPFGRLSG
jgi:hypothetical protein